MIKGIKLAVIFAMLLGFMNSHCLSQQRMYQPGPGMMYQQRMGVGTQQYQCPMMQQCPIYQQRQGVMTQQPVTPYQQRQRLRTMDPTQCPNCPVTAPVR